MSQPKKSRIHVDIYGQQYTIVGEEDSSHIRMVASIVDSKMKEINEKNPYLDTNKLAVLTAINIVNDYAKVKKDYDELLKKVEKVGDVKDND